MSCARGAGCGAGRRGGLRAPCARCALTHTFCPHPPLHPLPRRPTNDAFGRLPKQFLAYLLSNVTALDEVLTYHVVAGNVSSTQLYDGELIPTLQGSNITVHKDQRGAIFVDFAQVIAPNNEASNGVAHIIDEVILPFSF